jgi:glycosyltransferase involved in cell wall biosynthesis
MRILLTALGKTEFNNRSARRCSPFCGALTRSINITKQGMRLLIVSSIIHYRYEGHNYAYGPYAREIDLWAALFSEVAVAAPCRDEPPPGDCLPLSRPNITLLPQKEVGGETLLAKLLQILALPTLISGLVQAMRGMDAIHVRCPGNLGLLGVVIGPLLFRYRIAKFAGQWCGYPGEPRTVWVQRLLLRSPWWRGPVTVYGRWPGQPNHVIPFFTSIMTADQMARARRAADRERLNGVPQLLYVGRLSQDKNVDVLLAAIAQLKSQGIRLRCAIVGDGPERQALAGQLVELNLQNDVELAGSVSFEQVLTFYEQADILVLASESEGWPKAIAEAMAFGVVCIGSDRGLIPEMLGEGRGLIVPPGDVDRLAAALNGIITNPRTYQSMRLRAAAWAQQYSLDGLGESLRNLLCLHWKLELGTDYKITSTQPSHLHQ